MAGRRDNGHQEKKEPCIIRSPADGFLSLALRQQSQGLGASSPTILFGVYDQQKHARPLVQYVYLFYYFLHVFIFVQSFFPVPLCSRRLCARAMVPSQRLDSNSTQSTFMTPTSWGRYQGRSEKGKVSRWPIVEGRQYDYVDNKFTQKRALLRGAAISLARLALASSPARTVPLFLSLGPRQPPDRAANPRRKRKHKRTQRTTTRKDKKILLLQKKGSRKHARDDP
jgi:hypothetical protein